MKNNFKESLRHVLKHEGGYVNHPRDPGGHTNKGVTLRSYRMFVNRRGTVEDLKNISDREVRQVYKKQYWDQVKGDQLPSGVDYAVFDFAVNSGPQRAARYLQSVVGAKVDGVIGPKTLAAVQDMEAKDVIKALCDKRLAFLKRLRIWGTFGRGWSRRVSSVRKDALKLSKKKEK